MYFSGHIKLDCTGCSSIILVITLNIHQHGNKDIRGPNGAPICDDLLQCQLIKTQHFANYHIKDITCH